MTPDELVRSVMNMQVRSIKAVQQNTAAVLNLTAAVNRLSASVQDMVVVVASLPIEEDSQLEHEGLLPGEKAN
jgi:hypothetical protein